MNLARDADPIVAIATAPGRGAVGIVRVSGAGLGAWFEALCGRALRPREATLLAFLEADGRVIDQGLAIYFPAPHSYTGEDVLELQAHGGPVVLQLLLARCLQAGAERGLRVAEPGEFTRRAFLNDKLDLAQAEAVADLIDASTEAAARSAGRSLVGAFSREIDALRERLIHLRMLVEATLDFPEEDIDFLQQADAKGQLDALLAQLGAVRAHARQGALLREGITVAIAGQPNVGKSSLLNALAGAELAIVTPIAGTTRDLVSQSIQIEGVPLHVVDTAGLRESEDPIERIGIERAWAQIEKADAVLFVHDLTRCHDPDYAQSDAKIASSLKDLLPAHTSVLHLWNKADAAPGSEGHAMPTDTEAPVSLAISARHGTGLDALRLRLLEQAGWQQPGAEGVYIARQRHLHALERVQDHVAQARAMLGSHAPALDLMAEELRQAQKALNEITGEFGADELLGVIFSSFCIGK